MPKMKATVFRRKGRAYFEVQWTDATTGRKVTRSTGETTKKLADRAAGKIIDDAENERLQKKLNTTWDEFCSRYETEVGPKNSVSFRNKLGTLFDSIDSIIGPKLLRALDANQISRLQTAWRDRGLTEASIKGYLSYLKSALRWAVKVKILAECPEIDMPTRTATAKGRALVLEEFERVLDKVPAIVLPNHKNRQPAEPELADRITESWRHLLRGLWLSGLRLHEALRLSWDDPRYLCVDLTGRRPVLRIQPDAQKGNRYEETPIVPEFDAFLRETPEEERTGFVFSPLSKSGRPAPRVMSDISAIIVEIGRKAGVKVSEKATRKTGPDGQPVVKVKYASAHDFRRSFGTTWSKRVMPPILMRLMRHESIQTTMSFYVSKDAMTAADAVWAAAEGEPVRNANSPANIQPASIENA